MSRAAITSSSLPVVLAALILTLLYVVIITGLQGVVSPARLQAHSSDALVYTAQAIGGTGWARVMAFALAKSSLSAPASQNWSLLGVLVVGLVLMVIARFGYDSPFFSVARESDGCLHRPRA